jgi:hypothetical protein
VVEVEKLDVYGEIEPAISRALVRSAFLAGALDTLDPKEDQVARTLAQKVGLGPEADSLRNEAEQRVETDARAENRHVQRFVHQAGEHDQSFARELPALVGGQPSRRRCTVRVVA